MKPRNDVLRIRCGIQHYDWGTRLRDGATPYIANLLGLEPSLDTPYAELWVGAHPDLPARVVTPEGDVPLDAFIEAAPRWILGDRLVQAGYRSLPFLLKILSCSHPLSIQAHPDKALAERLHRAAPETYPDSNHKPEIAIALTDFEALCQFRSETRIRADLKRINGLSPLLQTAASPDNGNWLRGAYGHLFTLPAAVLHGMLEEAVRDIRARTQQTEQDLCFLRLAEAYPGDRGTLSAYFLNRIRLRPGQAIFVGANQPHAYLCGTIVECMANSNNVVRAGLTRKTVDADVLLNMLDYRAAPPRVIEGSVEPGSAALYNPPAEEFHVAVCRGPTEVNLGDVGGDGPALLLVLDGEIDRLEGSRPALRDATRGSTWLVPAASRDIRLALKSGEDRLVIATPNL